VIAMNPTQQVAAAGTPVRPRVDQAASCGCGQDLERCSTAHCPRCGTQLGPLRFEATGFWQAA
jgi:predicted amidophosphoribosyltransferase